MGLFWDALFKFTHLKQCVCWVFLAKVTAPDVYPILPPQSGDRQPENVTRWLLEGLLAFMVSEVSLLCIAFHWQCLLKLWQTSKNCPQLRSDWPHEPDLDLDLWPQLSVPYDLWLGPAHLQKFKVNCWRGYLSEASCKSLYMVQLMPLPPHHLCFRKSRMVYPSLGNVKGCTLVYYCADLELVPGFCCYDIHSAMQCYRPTVQCKHVSMDVNAVWTAPSQVYPKPIPFSPLHVKVL